MGGGLTVGGGEDERGETQVVNNGVMKGGGRRGSGRDCVAVRQMY